MSKQLLISGACLQGNKGGPALILSLIDLIRRHTADEVSFAVSVGARDLQSEALWGEKYGIKVIPMLSVRDLLPPWSLQSDARRNRHCFLDALNEVTAVVDTSGLSYIGPPTRGFKQSLSEYLRSSFVIRAGKPFVRFTQTYGPMSSRSVRWLAKRDLRRLDVVMARGKVSRAEVEQLELAAPVYDFPDVAFSLRAAPDEWAGSYLGDTFGLDDSTPLIAISPSATMERYLQKQRVGSDLHLRSCIAVIETLLTAHPEFRFLIIPHTIRVDQSASSSSCDLALSRKVIDAVGSDFRGDIFLVAEDLDARALKALIARAHFQIGARYHSLVAALSSGVPSVGFAWHHKYREMFMCFGLEDLVIPAERLVAPQAVGEFVLEQFKRRDSLRSSIQQSLPEVVQKVEDSGRILTDVLANHGALSTAARKLS